ncbi:cell division protein ZapD [Candidatus Methylospira mobilis]|uniref:Cell division protein ZapD n=1 Tax=Candidatus Methylospira mobilis TaxID=1808979 RepID=A0A5Q0BMF5_9GAMM|nr:cell division protein ZapD [Candidatus Methylospira mobilis]QFY44789.1 cell division protein ZapD [Candidatus Methylospira mobilis]WNV05670.1 cell division protein ZapD [Candidatus Methylospira mobilis]
MSSPIIYEFPLNERIRAFLRLERLFDTIDFFMRGDSEFESSSTVGSLLELLGFLGRVDLKSECIKELDRYTGSLEKLMDNPEVEHGALEKLLAEIAQTSEALYSNQNKIGLCMAENELLKAVGQKGTALSAICAFDLPYYHYWLRKDDDLRRQDLLGWIGSLDTLRKAVDLSLHLIRNSANITEEQADNGFFQKSLDAALPFQMLQVELDDRLPYFAEFSGGKQRFSIRFMNASIHERPAQTSKSISFTLSCCAF